MKRVLLVTIQNNSNFGNRLQNYALQTVVESMNCRVDNLTLSDVPLASMRISNSQKMKNAIKSIAVGLGIKKYKKSVSLWTRKRRCMEFSQKYIHHYLIMPSTQIGSYDFGEYDVAITGSDQVWHNWKRIPNELSYYYLEFIDENKRISYAPSFGFKEFSSEDIEEHKKGLNHMRMLSSREKEGCELIYGLTQRKAQLVLDPTLLLSSKQWETIEKKPSFDVPDKYLLQFMLGKESEEYHREVTRIAQLKGLTVINIGDANNERMYGISPDEFIWLIHHSDTICTDSFHAAVFSILFEKNLCVFERIAPEFGNMFGRLHNLLSPLGLERLIYSSSGEKNFSTRLDRNAREYFDKCRADSIAYLKMSLDF